MALSSRICPDCGQRYRGAPATTITGRKVCPDCAQALFTATVGSHGSPAKGAISTFLARWRRGH